MRMRRRSRMRLRPACYFDSSCPPHLNPSRRWSYCRSRVRSTCGALGVVVAPRRLRPRPFLLTAPSMARPVTNPPTPRYRTRTMLPPASGPLHAPAPRVRPLHEGIHVGPAAPAAHDAALAELHHRHLPPVRLVRHGVHYHAHGQRKPAARRTHASMVKPAPRVSLSMVELYMQSGSLPYFQACSLRSPHQNPFTQPARRSQLHLTTRNP